MAKATKCSSYLLQDKKRGGQKQNVLENKGNHCDYLEHTTQLNHSYRLRKKSEAPMRISASYVH